MLVNGESVDFDHWSAEAVRFRPPLAVDQMLSANRSCGGGVRPACSCLLKPLGTCSSRPTFDQNPRQRPSSSVLVVRSAE